MNYFDDLDIFFVSKAVLTADGKRNAPGVSWAVGLMLGNGICGRKRGDKIHYIKMPFLYIVSPEEDGAWLCVNGVPRENYWFSMKGDRAARMAESFYEYCSKEYPFIPLKDCRELIKTHQKMWELFKTHLPSRKYLLALASEEFAAAFYDTMHQEKEHNPTVRFVAELAEKIAKEPGKNYDIKLIAAENHISKDHLSRLFRQYTGSSLHRFLLQKRLDTSLELLENSLLSIKEISQLAGFPRQAEFARFIRNKTGKSPSWYRKGIRPFYQE